MDEATVVFDIETDDHLRDVSVVHCISAFVEETSKSYHFGPKNIVDGLGFLKGATHLVGHNIVGYDLPVLQKLHNFQVTPGTKITDTLLVDYLLKPEEFFHSLDAVGKRIGAKVDKVVHEDWSTYTPHMKLRCDDDVRLNYEIYLYQQNCTGYKEILPSALEREQEFLWLHSYQALRGFSLDVGKAVELYRALDAEAKVLESQVSYGIPAEIRIHGISVKFARELRRLPKGPDGFIPDEDLRGGARCYKGDGEYTKATIDFFKEDPNGLPIGPYSKLNPVVFNINSPAQVQKYLLHSCGWKPTTWNKKQLPDRTWINTTPKLTEDSFDSIKGSVGQLIARYNIVKHRRGILLTKRKKDGKLTGFLADAHRRGDGRVSGDGITCGTNTSRVRHRVINSTVAR